MSFISKTKNEMSLCQNSLIFRINNYKYLKNVYWLKIKVRNFILKRMMAFTSIFDQIVSYKWRIFLLVEIS